jgi:hypothetical protein
MSVNEKTMTRIIMQHVTFKEVWAGNGYNQAYVTEIDVPGLAKALVKRFEKEATK